MYLQSIILAIITIIITTYIVIKSYKEQGFNFIKMLIGIVIALIFLSYPLYEDYEGISRIGCSILHALQTLTLGENFELVSSVMSTHTLINMLYIILTYTLYFIAPLLTATALLSIFSNTFSRLRIKISNKKSIIFFHK